MPLMFRYAYDATRYFCLMPMLLMPCRAALWCRYDAAIIDAYDADAAMLMMPPCLMLIDAAADFFIFIRYYYFMPLFAFHYAITPFHYAVIIFFSFSFSTLLFIINITPLLIIDIDIDFHIDIDYFLILIIVFLNTRSSGNKYWIPSLLEYSQNTILATILLPSSEYFSHRNKYWLIRVSLRQYTGWIEYHYQLITS